MSKFIRDINNLVNRNINEDTTIRTGEITVDNGDGTYDVKIANASKAIPNVETMYYDVAFSVGEIVDIGFEYGSKEAPKIMGHAKKIAQEPKQVEVDYSGAATEETVTVYGSISDGVLRKVLFTSNYTAVHDASEASYEPESDESNTYHGIYTLQIGQTYADFPAEIYDIQRTALIFDTSSIPTDADITSAIIYLYCWNSTEGTAWFAAGYGGKLLCSIDFDIVIQNGQPTYPHTPVVKADYNYTLYSGNGGSVNTADINEGSFNTITLNSTGRDWINKGGNTKLLLRSSKDISSTISLIAPETIGFISSDFTSPSGYIPKLVITYTI